MCCGVLAVRDNLRSAGSGFLLSTQASLDARARRAQIGRPVPTALSTACSRRIRSPTTPPHYRPPAASPPTRKLQAASRPPLLGSVWAEHAEVAPEQIPQRDLHIAPDSWVKLCGVAVAPDLCLTHRLGPLLNESFKSPLPKQLLGNLWRPTELAGLAVGNFSASSCLSTLGFLNFLCHTRAFYRRRRHKSSFAPLLFLSFPGLIWPPRHRNACPEAVAGATLRHSRRSSCTSRPWAPPSAMCSRPTSRRSRRGPHRRTGRPSGGITGRAPPRGGAAI